MHSESDLPRLAALGLWLGVAAGPAASAPGPTSVYTELASCRFLAHLDLQDRQLGAASGSQLRRCAGPKGFSVVLVDDGERSWLAVEAGPRTDPLDRDMVETFAAGNFPSVAEPGRVEWRLDAASNVKGLIVRVRYQRRDVPATSAAANGSVLMIFRLPPGQAPRLVGTAIDNAEARRLLDDTP